MYCRVGQVWGCAALVAATLGCVTGGNREGPKSDLNPRIDALIQKRLPMLQRNDLHVAGERLGDEELEAILADSRVPMLHTLDVADNRLSKNAVDIVLSSPKAAALRLLDLTANPIGDAGLAQLASSRRDRPNKLMSLGLVGVDATARGARALARASLPALARLHIGWQNLGDDGARALAGLPALDALDVTHSEITGPGARALIAGTRAKKLVLAENPIEAGSLRGLEAVSGQLRWLSLRKTRIGAGDAAVLAALDTALQGLDLAYCPLADRGLGHLARARWLAHLQTLDVSSAGTSPAGRKVLRQAWGPRPGLVMETDSASPDSR